LPISQAVRRKDPRLEAACKAAIAACTARIPEFLAGSAVATFDPEAIPEPGPNPLPKVTIAEAIKIAQLNARAAERDAAYDPFAEQAAQMSEDDMHELRERVLMKLGRLKERTERERLEEGWMRDEATGHLVPPGWVRAG